MSDGVRFELFGAARVFRGAASAPGLGKKALGLIAYLSASADKLHNRDHLASLLWPDRFEEQARQSLRQTLTSVRKVLGEALLTDEGGVGLAGARVTSDVGQFETLLASRDIESVRSACALYGGDFLETLSHVSSEFDDWAEQERRRLRDLYFDALEILARGELDVGRPEDALTAAQRLLGRDPANEAGCRAAMTALARLGRRSAALRQYESCKSALARTLDAAPSQETLELAERIQAMASNEASELSDEPAVAGGVGSSLHARRLSPRAQFALVLAGFAVVAAVAFLSMAPSQRWLGPWGGPGNGENSSACAAAIGLPNPVAPTIAVLPLQYDGSDEVLADFAANATLRISDLLGDVPALVVKRAPRGRDYRVDSPLALAGELGVSHLIEGDVRAEGEEVLVTIRLINGATGEVVQSYPRTYDLDRNSPRRTQDIIAISAAELVQVHLTEGEQALHYYAYPTTSMEVFEHLTRAAQHFDEMSRAHNARARVEYAAANALDPDDPRAISGLGWTYLIDAFFGWSAQPDSDLARAKDLARRAISSDRGENYFYPHSLLGLAALMEGEHAAARAHGEEAVRVSGSGADASAVLALILTYTGDYPRSMELGETAMRRRPHTYPLWYEWIVGRAARLNGQTDLALACLPLPRVRDASFLLPQMDRAAALAESGELERARREMNAISGRFDGALTAAAYCARPPYASAALTERCVADLQRAGLD